MDFKRIQVLLLLFFIVFDIYLITLLYDRLPINLINNDPAQSINAVQEMGNRGVEIHSDVTHNDAEPFLYVLKSDMNEELRLNRSNLTNQTVQINTEGVLESGFIEPIELDIALGRESEVLSEADFNWIRENILLDDSLFINGELYSNHWYSPQSRQIIVRMVTEEGLPPSDFIESTDLEAMELDSQTLLPSEPIPISDGSADLRLFLDENHNLVGYQQTFQTPMYALEEPKQLISSHQALEVIENRIDTTLPNDAVIVSLNLSYYRSTSTQNFNIFTPAWEVIYYRQETGQTQSILVDAIRSSVVSQRAAAAQSMNQP